MKQAIRIGLLTTTLVGSAALAVPATAQVAPAQQDAVPGDASSADPTSGPQNEAGIVITGTRINNPNLEQASPVAVVTEDEIQLRQSNTVEQFLREIPGVVPSVGSNVNNGNGGNTLLDLRGIGSNRNITLLNSTRIVPATLAGTTNLDIIPVALLDRVDVLTGGAGSTYGADAISGVVNFITKRDFAGVEASATEGITEEGDGNELRADLTLGANFEDGRGNAVLSVGYSERDAVFQGDRRFSVNNISSFDGTAGGSSTAVPTRFSGLGGIFPGTGTLQVAPGGQSLIPFYQPFNFNPFNVFQTPLKQYRIYGAAHYEVTPGLELFSEGLFVKSSTSTIIAPSGSFGNSTLVPLSNPFLPAGIRNQICGRDTSAATPGVQRLFTQAQCDAAALATDPNDPNFRTFNLVTGRRFTELGPRTNEYQTTLFQIKGGLRGNIVSNVNYEITGAYGESENRSQQFGNGTLTRLRQSLFSTDPNNCLDPTGGCVPIDIFGPEGSITPAVGRFLDIGNQAATKTSLAQVIGFIDGDFGVSSPLAAQPISFVIGGEYRKYTAATSSDLLSQTPDEVLGNGAANPDSFGKYHVKEVFGELAIPIIEDRPGFQELTLQLGGRVSDYTTSGTEYTYKAGGTYTPFRGFQFRGSYQRVTRAPNIGELVAPVTTGLDNYDSDPCAGAAPLNNANLAAVCLAQGAPAGSLGSIIVDPGGQVNVTGGGNPNLDSEKANTFTAGVIFQPSFVPGLAITADYYNIKVKGAVSSPTVDDGFIACFGPNYKTNPVVTAASATDPACTSIGRDPLTGLLFGSSAATGIPQPLSNLGNILTDGVDVVVNYKRDLGFAGFNVNFNGNWTNRAKFQATPTSINRECVNYYSSSCASIQPEFSFTERTTLTFQDIDVSLLWRWINGVEIEPSVAGTFLPEFERIGDQHYFDLTFRANATENLALTVGAYNLFDNKPPIVGSNVGSTAYNSGNTYPSTYDALGRRYSVTARLKF